jgi:hypothetical protein
MVFVKSIAWQLAAGAKAAIFQEISVAVDRSGQSAFFSFL